MNDNTVYLKKIMHPFDIFLAKIVGSTVKPPNKGHIGDNINSAVLSLIERLSSFRGSRCIKTIGHVILGLRAVSFVERFIIQCPYFGGSTIRGSTVYVLNEIQM